MSPQAAQIIVTAQANPTWSGTRLLLLESPVGRTHTLHLVEALDSGLLKADGPRWTVREGYDDALVRLCPGVLCACNQAMIPYAGEADEDIPAWTDSRGCVHVFDGVCE